MDQVIHHEGARSSAHETVASRRSFEQFYLEHFAFVLGNARRLGVQSEEAEDVAQEVFITAYRLRHSQRQNVSSKAWLYGITRRVAAVRRRTRNRRTRKIEALTFSNSIPSTLDFGDRVHAGQLVEYLLSQIDEEKQEVFVLAELFDMSGREIADALGINVSTGASRLRLARAKFRKLVAQYEPKQPALAQATLLANARAQQKHSKSKALQSWALLVAALGTPATHGCSAAVSYITKGKLAPVWHIGSWLTTTFVLLWGTDLALSPSGELSEDSTPTNSGCSVSRIFDSESGPSIFLPPPPPPNPQNPTTSVSNFSELETPQNQDLKKFIRAQKLLELARLQSDSPRFIEGESDLSKYTPSQPNTHKSTGPINRYKNDLLRTSVGRIPPHSSPSNYESHSEFSEPENNSNDVPQQILSLCSNYCIILDHCRPQWGDCNERCIQQYKDAISIDPSCEEPFSILNQCVLRSDCTEIKDYILETSDFYPCQKEEFHLIMCKGYSGGTPVPGL